MIRTLGNNSFKSVLGKTGIAACVYNVWKERNMRLFQNSQRSEEDITSSIKEDLKWKIMSLKLKNTANVRRILKNWNVPYNCVCG